MLFLWYQPPTPMSPPRYTPALWAGVKRYDDEEDILALWWALVTYGK